MDISVKSYDKFNSSVNFGSKMLLQGEFEVPEQLWKTLADAFEKATPNAHEYYIVSEDDEYIKFSNVDRNYTTALLDKSKAYGGSNGFGLWDKGFKDLVSSMIALAETLKYESNIAEGLNASVDWNSKPRGLNFDVNSAQQKINNAREEANEKSRHNIEKLLEKAPVFRNILVDIDLEPHRKK